MQRSLATLPAAALLAGSISAQGAVGAYAPEVEARDWFNAPSATSLQELRGNVVLLVFWATW
jgi:hypothetical protein